MIIKSFQPFIRQYPCITTLVNQSVSLLSIGKINLLTRHFNHFRKLISFKDSVSLIKKSQEIYLISSNVAIINLHRPKIRSLSAVLMKNQH